MTANKIIWLTCTFFTVFALGCVPKLSKIDFDNHYNRVEIEEKTDFEDVFSSVDSPIVRASFKSAPPSDVERFLNLVQNDYRIYFKTSISSIDFDVDGRLVEELERLALLYDLQFKVFDRSIYLSDDSIFQTTYNLPFNLTTEEIASLSRLYPSLSFANVRSSSLVSGSLNDVEEFFKVFPRSSDRFVLSLVLLTVDENRSFELSAKLNFETVDLISKGLRLVDVFKAQGVLSGQSGFQNQYYEQQIYMTLGQKVSFNFGTEAQREQRSISDAGTSTVSGYQTFRDGVEVEATINKELDSLLVDLTFDRSKFSDVSTLSRSLNNIQYERLKVSPNRLYYLTQFHDSEDSKGLDLLGFLGGQSRRSVMVWFAVFPVTEKSFEKASTIPSAPRLVGGRAEGSGALDRL